MRTLNLDEPTKVGDIAITNSGKIQFVVNGYAPQPSIRLIDNGYVVRLEPNEIDNFVAEHLDILNADQYDEVFFPKLSANTKSLLAYLKEGNDD